ncbi:MAG: FecR domain-containing protein [Bacteroidales bacterium]|nr:FecR domain-containing protein [Bacteroidales bacterium]
MNDSKLYFYLNGDLTPNEQREVEVWIRNNPEHFEKIKRIWEHSNNKTKTAKPDLLTAWEKINPEKRVQVFNPTKLINGNLRKLLKFAAMVMLFISIGIVSYYTLIKTDSTAWIKFASGNEKNVELLLDDGSKIWLNAGAVISHPKKFNSHSRSIILNGEALFEVAKNKNKPFIIQAGNTITQVLGTSFTINANDTSNTITLTVIDGKVAFYNKTNTDQQVFLVKGEQGVYAAKEQQITKQKNKDRNFMAWKTSTLVFNNASLTEVCETLNRYYDTLVFIRQPELLQQQLTARFQNKTLPEILDVLEITCDLSCKTEKNGIELIAN